MCASDDDGELVAATAFDNDDVDDDDVDDDDDGAAGMRARCSRRTSSSTLSMTSSTPRAYSWPAADGQLTTVQSCALANCCAHPDHQNTGHAQ